MFWGSNSVWTEPTYTSGQIGRSRDRGAKLIVIDPFFEHPLAAKADCFLGVRPGSDTYVAYAWLNVIMNEDLIDHEFVDNWCAYYDELKEHVQQFSPAWAASIGIWRCPTAVRWSWFTTTP